MKSNWKLSSNGESEPHKSASEVKTSEDNKRLEFTQVKYIMHTEDEILAKLSKLTKTQSSNIIIGLLALLLDLMEMIVIMSLMEILLLLAISNIPKK